MQICSNVIENLHAQVRRQVQEELGTAPANISSSERNARERKRKKLEAAAIGKVFANKMKPLEQSEIYDEVRTAARRAIRRRRKRDRGWTLDDGQEPKDGLRDLDLDDWASQMEKDGRPGLRSIAEMIKAELRVPYRYVTRLCQRSVLLGALAHCWCRGCACRDPRVEYRHPSAVAMFRLMTGEPRERLRDGIVTTGTVRGIG